MCPFGDIRNSVHEKNHGILLNFVQLCDTEILEVMRNFVQFRTKYGRDGRTVLEKHTDFRVDEIPWKP